MKRTENPNDFILNWYHEVDQKQLSSALKGGAIAICSTDTILGFLATTTEDSYNKIQFLKGESRGTKPFIILIGSPQKTSCFASLERLSAQQRKLIAQAMPGPVTFILPAKKEVPSYLTSEHGTIALRCPSHKGLQAILSEFDGLFSTSANVSGRQSPKTLSEVDKTILSSVDIIIVDDESDENDENTVDKEVASTILDCSKEGRVRVLRSGPYPIEKLESFYGGVFDE